MWRTLVLSLAACSVFAGGAGAQTSSRAKRYRPQPSHAAAAIDRVPEKATNGIPGSANSARPDANVPPLQTPQDPLKR